MIRALPQSPPTRNRTDLSQPDGAAEILRQALAGFMPPSAALFHLFDRMESPQ